MPEVALVPVQLPDAVQLVVSVPDQVRVLEPPLATVAGLTLKVTVGVVAGGAATVTVTDCDALPLGLLHDNV